MAGDGSLSHSRSCHSLRHIVFLLIAWVKHDVPNRQKIAQRPLILVCANTYSLTNMYNSWTIVTHYIILIIHQPGQSMHVLVKLRMMRLYQKIMLINKIEHAKREDNVDPRNPPQFWWDFLAYYNSLLIRLPTRTLTCITYIRTK